MPIAIFIRICAIISFVALALMSQRAHFDVSVDYLEAAASTGCRGSTAEPRQRRHPSAGPRHRRMQVRCLARRGNSRRGRCSPA